MLWQARYGLVSGRAAHNAPPAAVGTYNGPGDVAGWNTAYGYWGLRGYNSTKIGANCIDVCTNANGAAVGLQTLVIGSSGYVDTSSVTLPVYVYRIYDQSGASGVQDLFAPGGGGRPVLTAGQIGGLPAMRFNAGEYVLSTPNAIGLSQAISTAIIAKPDAGGAGMAFTDGQGAFMPLWFAGTACRSGVSEQCV